jgi:sugar transferase EpsL
MTRSVQPGKRLFDLLVTLPALVALSPVMAATAWVAARNIGRPILFRQQRPGLGGRPFVLLKFRTMTDARDTAGALRSDSERLTSYGRFLRRTSLDELPQLWNVARGEMSLVGPRPLLMEYLPGYTEEQRRRHDVMPGVTGWAQINGRNVIHFSERLKFDVWYVDHWSLWLDIKILARTFLNILQNRGGQVEQALAEVDDIGLHPDTRRGTAERG